MAASRTFVENIMTVFFEPKGTRFGHKSSPCEDPTFKRSHALPDGLTASHSFNGIIHLHGTAPNGRLRHSLGKA
jgi:hypothetical protein